MIQNYRFEKVICSPRMIYWNWFLAWFWWYFSVSIFRSCS